MSRILRGSLSKEKSRDVAVAVGGEGRQWGSSEPGRDKDEHGDADDVD